MRAARRSAVVLVAVSFLAAGCGDGKSPTDGGSGLSKQASMAIFSELMVAMFSAMGQAGAPPESPSGLGALTASSPETFTVTSSCAQGGSINVSMTVDDRMNEAGTGSIAYNMVQTPNACKVTTPSGTFTVNGAPNLSWGGTMQFTNFNPSANFVWKMTGGYSFTGSEAGTCQVDLTYNMNINTGSGSLTGKMCGHSMNETF
jgi:hypothetical protein